MKPAARLALLLAAAGALTLARAEDVLFMTNGVKRVGTVVAFDGRAFRLQVALARPAGVSADSPAPMATVSVPRAEVEHIEFAPDPARDQFLKAATSAQIDRVAALWNRQRPLASVPRSPAARIGITYADLLLQSGKPADAATALALCREIEAAAWSPEDKAAAGRGRLRAMIATGDAKSAVTEAIELARTAEDPSILIEAKFILARAADESLRKLVADNPRWQDDPIVIPEHARLLNEALDNYLYPALFFGSDNAAASRGLAAAADIYRFVGDTPLALETTRDILTFYPGTPAAKSATTYLATLTPEQQKQDYEKDARDEARATGDAAK